MSNLTRILAISVITSIIVIGVIGAGAFLFGVPTGLVDSANLPVNSGVESGNDGEEQSASLSVESTEWGEVTQDSIEIQSDLAINNPRTSFQSDIQYVLLMNDIEVAAGGSFQQEIGTGETTVPTNTEIQRDAVGSWWQSHVENGEQSEVTIFAEGRFSKGPFEVDPSSSKSKSIETDLIASVDQTVGNVEGEFPLDNVEISDSSAEWGDITEERSEVVISMTVENNMDRPLPITDFSGTTTAQNVQLLSWESESDRILIPPRGEEEIEVRTYLYNEKIGQWLGNHVENDEVTNYQNDVYISIGDVGANSPIVTCSGQMKTQMLEDNNRGIDNRDCEVNPPDQADLRDSIIDVLEQTSPGDGELVERASEARENVGPASEEQESNTAPNAVIQASETSVEAPQRIEFDASSSSDPDGEIMSYRWTIEGPTAGGVGKNLNRPFRREGNYEVELTVRDNDGETDTATETIEVTSPRPISDTDDSSDSTDSSEEDEGSDGGSTGESESESNDPPSADIAASRTSGTAPLSVEFDASGSSDSDGSIEGYEWNIEGQADANGQVVSREFTEPGSYEVELTVTDDDGAESTTSITVDVNAPPTASATADPSSGSAPLNVEFDGSGSSDPDGEIVRYRWQIDGPTPGGTGETITRRFQTRGSYDVTLTVTDDDGATDETTITVDVSGRLGKIEFDLI